VSLSAYPFTLIHASPSLGLAGTRINDRGADQCCTAIDLSLSDVSWPALNWSAMLLLLFDFFSW
jgi:hypothetical protein